MLQEEAQGVIPPRLSCCLPPQLGFEMIIFVNHLFQSPDSFPQKQEGKPLLGSLASSWEAAEFAAAHGCLSRI